jgi:hypothetical protein
MIEEHPAMLVIRRFRSMSHELERLETLAQIDGLVADLERFSARDVAWPPAREAEARLKRLLERTATMRVRIEAPLVVATLGGTGVGKSTLVNALVGDDVSTAGRMRPTTILPTFIARPGVEPEDFGIPPESVRTVTRDLPILREMVIIDCPDPDTTETAGDERANGEGGSNLARLRQLLPHCDVLLVVTTQQKYRSARVSSELASAAVGARLVFVQTHADVDSDIRDDWRRVLARDYAGGEMFFVDAAGALAAASSPSDPRPNQALQSEFARLVDFLQRELAGTAAARIRRANFLDLVDETLTRGRERLAAGLVPIEPLETAIAEQRTKLGAQLVDRVAGELRTNRRLWEDRLVDAVAARWGFSPFACLLRAYQAIGSLLSGYGLSRVRTPAQLALWGMFEGSRRLKQFRDRKVAEGALGRVAPAAWPEADLRTASIIVDGYAAEAGVDRNAVKFPAVCDQAEVASREFVDRAAGDLQASVDRLSRERAGRLVRVWYETLFIVVVAALVYRFLKNFLYDSWLIEEFGRGTVRPLYGLEFYLGAAAFLAAWSGLLLWSFTSRLKRGLGREIDAFREGRLGPGAVSSLFAPTEAECREIRRLVDDWNRLEQRAAELRRRLAGSESPLGHRK